MAYWLFKAEPGLENLEPLRQSRLSVAPVRDREWEILCALAGIEA